MNMVDGGGMFWPGTRDAGKGRVVVKEDGINIMI